MPTTSIRVDVKRRLYDLLSRAGDNALVQVSYGFPQERVEDRAIWLGSVTGTSEIANMKAGRKSRDDAFDIDVWVWANQPADGTGVDADEACIDLYATVENVLADSPTLNLEGAALTGLLHAVVSTVEGPTVFPTDEGHASQMRVVVSCKTRLT